MSEPAPYKGARVIVGGDILSTQPKPGETEIELLARRLRDDDSPERSDRSPGRLLLRSADFLDPAVYAPGRLISVIGTVSGVEERKVGELPYGPYDPYYFGPYSFGPRYRFAPYGWWW